MGSSATLALTRPIVGIENRTAQEVFDIMCDRFRLAALVAALSANSQSRQAEGNMFHPNKVIEHE